MHVQTRCRRGRACSPCLKEFAGRREYTLPYIGKYRVEYSIEFTQAHCKYWGYSAHPHTHFRTCSFLAQTQVQVQVQVLQTLA